MPEKEFISIRLPKDFAITAELIDVLQVKNPHLKLRKSRGNCLAIGGVGFAVQEQRVFSLKLGDFSEKLYEQTCKLNKKKEFRIQYAGNLMYIEMGTFGLISALTMAIGAGLYFWATQTKKGRVYSEDGEYKLPNPENDEDHIRVCPDISYISFDTAEEAKQDEWLKSFITVPPTLSIEIVSSKYALKEAQEKMLNVWMHSGAQVGVVVYPFGKKLYIYEKGKTKPKVQSILIPFTHKLLPGYSGDFSAFSDKF